MIAISAFGTSVNRSTINPITRLGWNRVNTSKLEHGANKKRGRPPGLGCFYRDRKSRVENGISSVFV
jgi:hypothetical protein